MAAGIAAALAAAIVVWLMLVFNRLVRARNAVDEAWAQIDVQLAQRADLVPRLVQAVRGYVEHESTALREVVEARAHLESARGPHESGEADDRLEGSLARLYALAEAYPDLDADRGFRDLQRRLAHLEDDVASARRYHNALVERYETLRQSFPALLVARALGFRRREYFDPGAEGRLATSVRTDE